MSITGKAFNGFGLLVRLFGLGLPCWPAGATSDTPGTAVTRERAAYPDSPAQDDPIARAIENAERLRRRGEFREAYRVVYSIPDGQGGRMGAALVNLRGSVLQDLGRLDEAEQHYRRALRMLEAEFGLDDVDLVSPLNDLGGLMLARGRLREAAQLRERSLELRQRHYPSTDPAVLRGLENLAAVRLAQKRYEDAGRLLERARNEWERRHPGGPEAAIALNGLGVLAQRKGQRAQAAVLFREAISRRRPDDEPLQVAQMMANLAGALDPDKAVAQYSEAIALVEKYGGVEHLMLIPLLDGQAQCLRALHRKREAREVAVRASGVRKANPGGFSVDKSALH
jgi:tetratricopeptide (TPR) repeat protein